MIWILAALGMMALIVLILEHFFHAPRWGVAATAMLAAVVMLCSGRVSR